MKSRSLAEMERLLELKFQKKQQVFAKIVAEEGRLRGRVAKLDAQAREAESSSGPELRAIGADVIWKAWIDRSKASLNLDLAQVLAQKERLKGTVRKDYGKLLVSRQLVADRREEEMGETRRRALARAIQSHFEAQARKGTQDRG